MQGYVSAQVNAMQGCGVMLPVQQTIDGDGRGGIGIAGRGFYHFYGGDARRLQVDADHLAIGVHRGGGVGIDADLSVHQA